MAHDWQELSRLILGEEIIIERIRLKQRDISIGGQFEPPPLTRLTMEDQIFVVAFIRCHGSIKDMEELFDISYPTVKNRLNRIAGLLEFVDVNPPFSVSEILTQLEQGQISVEEAEEKLKEGR